MTNLDRNSTVAQIVTDHAPSARVFQKYGIDYCCRGNVTVEVACAEREVDAETVFAELAAVPEEGGAREQDPRRMSTAALVARIVDRHHGYLREALPYVDPIAAKVAAVHGPKDARLSEVLAVFRELAESLLPHLDEEEATLFPALMGGKPDAAFVRRELERAHEDHLAVGTLLARLRALTDGYAVPAWGCSTYRVLMRELDALEADTLRHVHLENHVLFPRFTGEDARGEPTRLQ